IAVDGRTIALRARAVVNAAGPWVDRVRRLEDPGSRPSMRLSKGVHVVVDGGEDWHAALTIPHDKVRVSFAVPWEGMLLLGATDLDRIAWKQDLDARTRAHLLHLYGSLAPEVLAPAGEDPSLLEPLVPGRPDLRAQELYARMHEWARTEEDVLRRRTTAWLAGSGVRV